MSDADDALLLACRARESWRTLQGTVVSWSHRARTMEAHRAAQESRGAHSSAVLTEIASAQGEPGDQPPDEQETTTRVWIALPRRGRSESRFPGGRASGDNEMTMVIDGDTFWMYQPSTGAISNRGGAGHRGGLSIDQSLLDPAPLVLASAVEPAGEVVVAGRRGIVLRLRPRERTIANAEDPDLVNWTASPRELVLDAERGIALRLTSFIDGQPFHSVAFTELAFDVDIPAERLTFTAPPGEEIRDAHAAYPGAESAPLHRIAAAASFVVLAATEIAPGWRVVARRMAALERPPMPESVHLFYGSGDGSVQINVNERALSAGDAADVALDGGSWRTLHRAGTEYRLWEADGDDWPMPRQVVFEREDTLVQVMSADLNAGALIAFAATFRPAATDPPSPTPPG